MDPVELEQFLDKAGVQTRAPTSVMVSGSGSGPVTSEQKLDQDTLDPRDTVHTKTEEKPELCLTGVSEWEAPICGHHGTGGETITHTHTHNHQQQETHVHFHSRLKCRGACCSFTQPDKDKEDHIPSSCFLHRVSDTRAAFTENTHSLLEGVGVCVGWVCVWGGPGVLNSFVRCLNTS